MTCSHCLEIPRLSAVGTRRAASLVKCVVCGASIDLKVVYANAACLPCIYELEKIHSLSKKWRW